jgi:putative oxidoreductase
VSRLRNPLLHAGLGVVLGALFVYASLDKIAKPADFARIIYHYQLIGPSRLIGPLPANLLAVTLPFVEILAGLLLIVGLWRREAALVTAGMLVVFILAVSASLARGIDVENCGCFSVSGAGRAAGVKLILEDIGMLAAALVLLLCPPRTRTTHEAGLDPPHE